MRGIENLFLEIFERKNGIIQQINQQKDLFNQHLASKLLIDGITPPSRLWKPHFHSHPKELNEEELITEFLFPQPTVPNTSGNCFLYNKPVVTADNEELSDGLFMETNVSTKGTGVGDEAKIVPECCDNEKVCVLNCVPEFDLSDTSPQDQTDVRVSNVYTAPHQSPARIQRSKSRQKALKHRNSASATSKRRLSHENNTGLSSSGITLSWTDSQKTDHMNVLFELAKPSYVINKSCVSKEIKEVNQSKRKISRTLLVEEGDRGSEERNKDAETHSTFEHEQLEPSIVPSLTIQAAGNSRGCLVEEIKTADPIGSILNARKCCDRQDFQHSSHLGNKLFDMREDELLSSSSIVRHCNNDLDLIGSDQNLPVFEGFILDAHTENGEVDIAEDIIDFGKLNLPSTTTECASILEKICRSSSMDSPMSYFSSNFNPHRTQDLYQSVPNGLLERVNLRSSVLPRDDDGKHLRASCSCIIGFHRISCSDSLSYTSARFGWNSKNPYMSPIGKPWEKKSSSSGNSGKRLSFSPELTCFAIEEIPCIVEENEYADKVPHKIRKGAAPLVSSKHAKREPFGEITEACLNPSGSVSASGKFRDRGTLDSVDTDVSLPGTHCRVWQKLRNDYGCKRSAKKAKENQALSVGTNNMKEANDRFSKPKLLGRTSLKRVDQRLSRKDSKHSNIVSGITSCVPVVQQKQAAAVCAGKRDVKVRALEIAGAAKLLEEKRETERRMKKEALRLERAKIEKENLKQRELNKKKKDDEQKKKDVNRILRKRAREEEERKQKQRKKNQIDARRPQIIQEEKLCAGDVEKGRQCGNMDEKVNGGNKFDGRLEKNQKWEKEIGDDNVLKRPETELRTIGILTSDVRPAGIVTKNCDAYADGDNGKEMSMLDKSPEIGDLVAKTSQEKLYEISPYQCLDDEEEDELPTKIFIPSWASKKCTALVLPSLQKIDPNIIFPRESFCSIAEVLLPRKLELR